MAMRNETKLRLLSGAAVVALAMTCAKEGSAQYTYPAQPYQTPYQAQYQPQYRTAQPDVERGPNKKLLVAGATVFGAAYVPSVAVGVFSDRTSDRALLVPLVGPWIALGGFDCDDAPCSSPGLDRALMIGSGFVQAIGAAGVVASLFVSPNTSLGPLDGIPVGGTTVRIAPTSFGRSGAGFGAAATF
jgi:hypothetical protein